MPTSPSHVSIIGIGNVGSAVLNALAASTTPLRIVALSRTLAKSEGECFDAEDATPLFADHEIVATDDYSGVAGSDVVVICAGAANRAGESRLALAGRNAETLVSIVRRLDVVAPHAVIVVVSNPVDVLTRLAIETSSRDERLIIGSGTLLDAVRLRHQVGRAFGVGASAVDVTVIGEHGRTAVPLWSHAKILGRPLLKHAKASSRDDCMSAALNRYDAILSRKGWTNTAIGACVAAMVGSIVRDDGGVYPVSVRPRSEYGILGGPAFGMPCSLGRTGVLRKHLLRLSAEEHAALSLSAATLNAAYESVIGGSLANAS
ncbi:MAG: L-lactate dehydrogenase [Candidatus Eremiobacteraeota bacterium]|nr:L-lactate dehydrogenase [Candidatus Eremiobacteraeota bacterium]